jgi:hypothetical protein
MKRGADLSQRPLAAHWARPHQGLDQQDPDVEAVVAGLRGAVRLLSDANHALSDDDEAASVGGLPLKLSLEEVRRQDTGHEAGQFLDLMSN